MPTSIEVCHDGPKEGDGWAFSQVDVALVLDQSDIKHECF